MNKELTYPAECYAIRGAIYEVHNEMGSGFREEVYQQCLERELTCRGIPYDAKKELRIYYSQSDSRAVGFVKRFVDIRGRAKAQTHIREYLRNAPMQAICRFLHKSLGTPPRIARGLYSRRNI